MLEAISSCAGETALVLWQICVALTVIMAMYPDKFPEQTREKIMIGFHIFVWGFAGGSTIIPWSLGLLGQNGVDGDPSNYWCWFTPGQQMWEQAQVRVVPRNWLHFHRKQSPVDSQFSPALFHIFHVFSLHAVLLPAVRLVAHLHHHLWLCRAPHRLDEGGRRGRRANRQGRCARRRAARRVSATRVCFCVCPSRSHACFLHIYCI
jgi:hypothetical protein